MSNAWRGQLRGETPPTMLDDLWVAIDPTLPERWHAVRSWGRSGVLLATIAIVGVPGAVLLDLAVLALRGDRDLLLSLRHAVELMVVVWVVAPPLGLLIGDALWTRGESRRAGARGPASDLPLDDGTSPSEDT
jgi:H+/Cl- antiporter ClcA